MVGYDILRADIADKNLREHDFQQNSNLYVNNIYFTKSSSRPKISNLDEVVMQMKKIAKLFIFIKFW